jgi:hypothetical protein
MALYTDKIRAVLEYQAQGPGTPRLFKLEYYGLSSSPGRPEERVWGVPVYGNTPELQVKHAAQLGM